MSQAAKQRDWGRFGQPWVAVSLDFEIGEKIDLVTLALVLLGFSVEQLGMPPFQKSAVFLNIVQTGGEESQNPLGQKYTAYELVRR